MPKHLKDPDLLRHQAYINGQWQDAENGATLAVINPATGEELGSVPRCTANDARAAIARYYRRTNSFRAKAVRRIKREWRRLWGRR